jgi:hypothetical protein
MNAARSGPATATSLLASRLSALTMLVSILCGAVCIWLFSPRVIGRPYRGFRLLCVRSCERGQGMTAGERTSLWFFIWLRQFAGGLAAMLLAMPLNMLLGTMGVKADAQIAALIGLFVIGPILMKMLVGQPLAGFRIEARRAAAQTAA